MYLTKELDMKTFLKKLKGRTGNSLAEFAVTTAMMATLATTAAPKFSGVGDGAKEKKTEQAIDQILTAANNFYNTKVTSENAGRFPGQLKYNANVPDGGGYVADTYLVDDDGNAINRAAEYMAKLDLLGVDVNEDGDYDDAEDIKPTFTSFDDPNDSDTRGKWASVFGTENIDAILPLGTTISSTEDDDGDDSFDLYVGAEEFKHEFGDEAIKSPFQDGHYIYTVIAATGETPIIFVADLENPSHYWKQKKP